MSGAGRFFHKDVHSSRWTSAGMKRQAAPFFFDPGKIAVRMAFCRQLVEGVSSMNASLLKIFRSVQVYMPTLQDYRFGFQRTWRKALHRPHEEDFQILNLIPKSENNVFLDIGANRGDAIQSILMLRPDAHVVAFEPNPLLIGKLRKLYGRDPRVDIQNFGLGNDTRTFFLHIPFYNNYMFDGLASFKEDNAKDWLKTRIFGYQSEKLRIKKVTCEITRLDAFSLKPYFVKIDVQGFEYEVLLGAERTIAESKPILLLETPGSGERDFLSQMRYQPFVFSRNKLTSGTHNYNVFFIHEDHVSALKDIISRPAKA